MFNDYSEVRLSVDLNQFAAELTEEILSRTTDQIERAVEDIDLSYQIEEAISDADIDGRIESYVKYDAGLPDEEDVARIAAEQALDVFRDEAPSLLGELLPGALRDLLLSLAAPPPAPVPVPEAAPAPLKEGDRVLVTGPVPGYEESFPRIGEVCSGTVFFKSDGLSTIQVVLDAPPPHSATAPYQVYVPEKNVRHA